MNPLSDDELLRQAASGRREALAEIARRHLMPMAMCRAFRQTALRFPVAMQEIVRLEFHSRPFDQFVHFRNISLAPATNPGLVMETGDNEVKPIGQR